MPTKKPRYTRRKKRTIRHPKRTPKSYNGAIKIKRYQNSIDCNGFSLQVAGTNGLIENTVSDGLSFVASSTPGGVQYGAWSFYAQLQDVTNYTEFAVLYDQYKIDKVVLNFIPYATGVQSGAAVSASYIQSGLFLHYAIDYDDAVPPLNTLAGLGELRQYPGYKCVNLIKKASHKITFIPKCNTAVSNNTNVTSAKKSEPYSWMDCDSIDVAGYGVKGVFENVSSGGTPIVHFLRCEVTYYLSFKNPR